VTAKAKNQSGNILIYILGAIFLMGLLIVALKGSFQEGSGIDPEKTAMLVGQVQRYGAELERGVAYVLRNGYSETDIRFAHPNAPSYGLITDIPARQVFSPEGGGVEWRAPPVGILQNPGSNYTISSGSEIDGVGSTCGTSRCNDLVMYLLNPTKDFCLAVNNANGITNPSGDTPIEPDSFTWNIPFDGTYILYGTVNTTGNYTAGKTEGCVKYTTLYYYYRVLLAR